MGRVVLAFAFKIYIVIKENIKTAIKYSTQGNMEAHARDGTQHDVWKMYTFVFQCLNIKNFRLQFLFLFSCFVKAEKELITTFLRTHFLL